MSASSDLRCFVQEQFECLRSTAGDKKEALFALFSRLNYRVCPELPPAINKSELPQSAQECLANDAPKIIATAGRGRGFPIIYSSIRRSMVQTAPLRLTDERQIANALLRENRYPECLLIFSDPEQRYWHFVNPKWVGRSAESNNDRRHPRYLLRRISVGPEDKLRTAIERFCYLYLPDEEADVLSPLAVQARHNEAFDVDKVTEEFFSGFKERFAELENILRKQTKDRAWAHDYALRLLSRIMFVYFIQRKRWLGNDPNFLAAFWRAYCSAARPRDTFFDQWLQPLFFEAFASPGLAANVNKHDYMPPEIREALRKAPYLNGGLFARDRLDLKYDTIRIPDSFFKKLLDAREGFFEHYNFTIAEDTPLDQEVAVDPEMIGRVYESLVNISGAGADDRAEQRQAGIFYTPRTEIDLMCRLALADFFTNHLGPAHRNTIYTLLFTLDPLEKEDVDKNVHQQNLWPQLAALVRQVTVLDPACGSGSFLVGMMNILYDLRRRAQKFGQEKEDDYQIKRDIIRHNLYGVDVMKWAVEIAELRLWLQLIVDTEIPETERMLQPLLPNLSFKILPGDSLVQQIGGINLAHLLKDASVDSALRQRLQKLQEKKLAYYDARQASQRDEQSLHKEERDLFLEILQRQACACEQKQKELKQQLRTVQHRLDGSVADANSPDARRQREEELEQLQSRIENLQDALQALRQSPHPPFIWELAFVEIFGGDKKGFDIVIGNPPYVRQERIADPQNYLSPEKYKEALVQSVYAAYPAYFGPNSSAPRRRLNRRSDLYVYFYFLSLSLLNDRGVFCFITSNSWLDVEYGAPLQEFLLRQVPIHLIIDNHARRSFAQADVNTIIFLSGAPLPKTDAALDHTMRFVAVKVPFEEILHPVIMEEIDEATGRLSRPEFRVLPRRHKELLQAGLAGEAASAQALLAAGRYEGDKWGGKYLRAPDIYYEILEAAQDKLVPLGEIAEVRLGLITGANSFFYVRLAEAGSLPASGPVEVIAGDGSTHKLPAEILYPAILRVKHIQRPRLTKSDTPYFLVCIPPQPYSQQPALIRRYIDWGEEMDFHKHSCIKNRPFWYSIEPRKPGVIIVPRIKKRRIVVGWNVAKIQVDGNLVEIFPLHTDKSPFCPFWAGYMLTKFWMLQGECSGRSNFGGGGLKVETMDYKKLLAVHPEVINPNTRTVLEEIFIEAFSKRPFLMIYDEILLHREENLALEEAFLAVLGIEPAAKRRRMAEELLEQAARFVWNRMARTGRSREARQSYEKWRASGQPFALDLREEEEDAAEDEEDS